MTLPKEIRAGLNERALRESFFYPARASAAG